MQRREHLVQLQGDVFLPLAAEDTGALHEEAVDLLASAALAAGGTAGERQAFLTHWRQVMAITTARGVAKVIKQRVPACTGAHWPVQPHHFQHIQDVVVPPQPRQHLPVRQPQPCMPCAQAQPAAAQTTACAAIQIYQIVCPVRRVCGTLQFLPVREPKQTSTKF